MAKKAVKKVETRGRKPNPEGLRYTGKPILLRCETEADRQELIAAAARAGVSLNKWLIALGLAAARRDGG